MDAALGHGGTRRSSPGGAQGRDGRSGEQVTLVQSLGVGVADALRAEAGALADRWRAQAPAVAPRSSEESIASSDPERAARLVETLSGALRGDAGCYDAVMRAGWELGRAAHERRSSLHHLLKELGLLEALVLYSCECALQESDAGGGAAEGMALARRLHRHFRVLTEAAAKGFTATYVVGLQDRFRALRHDLRNPLGTITNAVSLMSDETVPAATRDNPRYRQMLVRNATSLDAVIGDRLSDEATHDAAFSRQEVSLRGIALTVRRDLREEMEQAGCRIVVCDGLPTLQVDSTGLELALKSVLAGLSQFAAPDTDITIEPVGVSERSATVRVRFTPADAALDRKAVARAVAFAAQVLEQANGRLVAGDGEVTLEVSVPEPEPEPEAAA